VADFSFSRRVAHVKYCAMLNSFKLLFIVLLFVNFYLPAQRFDGNNLSLEIFKDIKKSSEATKLSLIFDFKTQPGWYLYWWNPGDSGEAIKFLIRFDSKAKKSYPILLSPPKRKNQGGITNYILENPSALLRFDFEKLPRKVEFSIDYLICEEICIPGSINATLSLDKIPVRSADDLEVALDFPNSLPSSVVVLEGNYTKFEAEAQLDFFPFNNQEVEIAQNKVILREDLKNIQGLLKVNDSFYKVGNWDVYPVVGNLEGYLYSLLTGLMLGIAAGVILNFMPCILPVIALKALQISDKKPALRVAFILGTSLSTLAVGSISYFSKEFLSEGFGWGFQFQNPIFVAIINFLLITTTLNLLGWLPLKISFYHKGSFPQTAGGQFLFGSFLCLLAMPCGAPVLVVLLSKTLTESFLFSFLSFLSLGFSFGFFFVLIEKLILSSKSLKALSSKGDIFKGVLAIPLLLTSFWFLGINQSQGASIFGVLCFYLLWVILLVSIKKIGLALVLVLISLYWFPVAFGKSSSFCPEDDMFEYGVRWKNFSPELVEDLGKNSIPFYLDVTASWCVTCKLNKLLVFSDEELKIKLQNKGFVFVRADWTSGDPQITLFLKKYGANYVPFNLVYHPKIGEKILPTLLSAQKVRLELSEILNED